MKTPLKFSILVPIFLLFLACSSSKQTTSSSSASSPSAGQWKRGVRGQWVLNSVEKRNFPAGASVKRIFDEAPIACFVGSTWNLIANGKGSITFATDGELCAPGATREIFWSIYKPEDGGEPQFQFKKLFPGEKAKDITEGYRLELAYADEQNLTLNMPVNTGGNSNSLLEFKFSKK
ncbi:hypothetical protein GCM10023231_26650 [Olivibacter ginsenosidimutans]|uniref:Lipocalin-like domain-containing protein n=1 Tax=Olivibacter ginsenosidimutans TaxID=1176537 RepID=A0ABP9BN12_9SPHI